MFDRILVPVDFSEANQSSLTAVSQLARPGATRVALLHVIEVVRNISFEELKSFYSGMEKKARAELGVMTGRLKEEGIDVESEITYGRRDQEILRFASEFGSDLIVLSSHQFNPESPVTSWGTISHKVSLISPCPVLLTK